MAELVSPGARRVQEALRAAGFQNEVIELTQSARSAVEAAQALGCRVEQIVKSLIFRTTETDRPILIVVSGPNRVDEGRIGAYLAEPIQKANAAFVRDHTGFAIGGVSPVGLAEPMPVLIDEDLLRYDEIWAAAGSPTAVFKLSPSDLVKMTGGKVVAVAAPTALG